MKMIVEIPAEDKERLISALKAQDAELLRYLSRPDSSIVRDLYEGKSEWPKQRSAEEAVHHFCCCFHIIAKRLARRYSGRTTLSIDDEYDVQDLFAALLSLEFTDIRKEEWSPSYAGGGSRIDFVLKPEQIVVEVKKTRDGLGARELGEQLIIDIARYRTHPDCQKLICFVYDPDGRISNPCGIENDLNGLHHDIAVKVIIVPKGV